MKTKTIRYISGMMVMLSSIGILLYKDTENDVMNAGFVSLFVLGFILSILINLKIEDKKLQSGKIKVAVKNYRFYEGADILLSIFGLLILFFSTYESFRLNKIEFHGIFLGLLSFGRLFIGVSKYFVRIDEANLRIKGTNFEIKKISEIRFIENKIQIYKGDALKEFGMQQLTEREKKEVYNLITQSEIRDKVYCLH